ncbi:hypothetical protein UJ101_02548 [Flavobacteriaceae bacterium UJ101]|nr:hypothetical protein UJ101_02548 [Flavobacteriaceae bacterium UJ101]
MGMEKKLSQMENRIIIFCLVCLFVSCKEIYKIKNDLIESRSQTKVKREITSFKPDMIINNQITFMKSCDFLENTKKYNGRIFIKNKMNTQCLVLGTNYGGGENEFKEAEIVYFKDLDFKKYSVDKKSLDFYTMDVKEFITESFIQLGMSKHEIIKKKGLDYEEVKNGISYVLKYPNAKILKEYNMPSYCANFYFKDGKLIEYSFGFETP